MLFPVAMLVGILSEFMSFRTTFSTTTTHTQLKFMALSEEILGGRESYGWLHQGPWVQVFEKIVETRIAEIAQTLHARKIAAAEKVMEAVKQTKKLLDDYVE